MIEGGPDLSEKGLQLGWEWGEDREREGPRIRSGAGLAAAPHAGMHSSKGQSRDSGTPAEAAEDEGVPAPQLTGQRGGFRIGSNLENRTMRRSTLLSS